MTGCGQFRINVRFLSNRKSDNASYICDAISEEVDLILAVSEEEEEGAAGRVGRRDTPPSSPSPRFYCNSTGEMWKG